MSENDKVRMWRLAGQYSAVGIEMATSVAFGAFGGMWLDKKFGHSPWLLWAGVIVGLGAASLTVMRVVRAQQSKPQM